jgi:flagellar hook-length control protein FliK
LGKIQLKITMENHLISAKFVAESEHVKALIETNFTDLKQMLSQNGVQVDQLMVSVGQHCNNGQNPTGNPFRGNPQPAFAGKQSMSETPEDESDYSGSAEPIRDNMRIDLIA